MIFQRLRELPCRIGAPDRITDCDNALLDRRDLSVVYHQDRDPHSLERAEFAPVRDGRYTDNQRRSQRRDRLEIRRNKSSDAREVIHRGWIVAVLRYADNFVTHP